MKRTLKRLGYAALVGVATLAALPLVLDDAIGERALEAVRNQLRTDLHVGGTSLSLLRDFPYASVGLTDVVLGGYASETSLLEAKQLSGRVSYYDLLFGEGWVINTVRIEDAVLRVNRHADKTGSWEVLASHGDTSSRGGVSFELSRILLRDVEVHYVDQVTESDVRIDLQDGELAGNFGSEAYTLNGHANGLSHHIGISGLEYASGMALGAEIELRIQPKEGLYRFGPSTVTLDDMPVDVSGTIGLTPSAINYDLALHTDDGRLRALMRALPRDWVTPAMRELDTRGAFELAGTVKGQYSALHSPAIAFEGRLQDGSLLVPALDRKATQVSFALDFDNGKSHTMADSRLTLSAINAELDGQPLNASFTWANLSDPLYTAELTGTLPLSWLDELWPEGKLGGALELRNVQLHARQRHLLDAKYARHVRTSGNIVPLRVTADFRGEHFDFDAERMELTGAALKCEGGQISGFDNRIGFDLNLGGFVPYLLGDTSQELVFAGDVATESIDLNDWVGLFSETSPDLVAKGEASLDNPGIATGFAARLNLRADQIRYNEVRGKRFVGSCTLKDNELKLNGEGYAMEGHWSLDGEMQLRQRPRLSAKLGCSEVNITELFEQTDNVGQDVVAAEHLDGQMTARVYVDARWDRAGELDTDALHVWANVGLVDGGLKDFEMLQALSAYVRAEELRNVRFTDVENWIEVEGSTVYLPAMFIQSTATNFTVAGEHSFEHDIDYSVRVNGAQVLLTKLFGKRQGIDFVPDRRNGWVKTGFKIDGTLVNDAYDVRMAGPAVRKHFRHSQRRKASIRRKLVGLFGAESLIDDYDDEGVRIPGRPQRGQARVARVAEAGSTVAATSDAPSTLLPHGRRVDVDKDAFLDFEDEAEEPSNGEETADGPRAALSGAGRVHLSPAPKIEASAKTRQASTSKPLAPSEAEELGTTEVSATPEQKRARPIVRKPTLLTNSEEEPGEEGEFMEGFDDIVIPDEPD